MTDSGVLQRLSRGRSDDRPRATWRILLPIVLVFGAILLAAPVLAALDPLSYMLVERTWAAIVTLGVLALAAYYLDRRSIADYGFARSREWWLDLLAGAVLGVGLMGAVFGTAFLRGTIEITEFFSAGEPGSFLLWIGLFLLTWVFVAFWEEVLFRGIFITNAIEGLSARGLSEWWAIAGAWAVSTIVFALVHAPMSSVPAGTSMVELLVVWTALGGLLGLAYVLSGSLAFPIGLHFTVNATANNLFGPAGGEFLLPAVVRYEAADLGAYAPIADLSAMLPAAIVAAAIAIGWFRLRDGDKNRELHNDPDDSVDSYA